MRRTERGFTLIELMITIAIVGILAAVAIPTYINFVQKGKRVEAQLAMDKLMKQIRVYHSLKSTLPQSSNTLPVSAACVNASGKTPQTPITTWNADPGWKELEFHIDEPGYYQYSWTKLSDQAGTAVANGDLDCDGIPGQLIVDVDITTSMVFETITTDMIE